MNNPAQTLIQLMQMGNNPNTIVQNAIRQNPQLNFILNQMQTCGLSPQQYVMQYARQMNIDIQPLISILNQNGMRL